MKRIQELPASGRCSIVQSTIAAPMAWLPAEKQDLATALYYQDFAINLYGMPEK